jgi:glycosyltransferase involved in cell wall biosynthesis
MAEAVISAKPLVSIVVTSYNHAEYLDERMQSLLSQTYDNIEINVIDDCSTDKSAEVLARYQGDSKVHITILRENGGYAKTCNIGLALSRGDYIMFAECDDFSEPSQIEALMEKMLQNPSVGVAFSRSNMVDSNGFIYGSDFDYREKLFRKFCSKDVLIPQKMMQNYFLISCVIPNMSAAIIRRKYFDLAGGFDSRYKACADWAFWCRIAEYCDFFYITKPLNNFRNHPATVRSTAGVARQVLEIFDVLYKTASELNMTMLENIRFRFAIGSVWATHVAPSPNNWIKSFFTVLRGSLKYDRFIFVYLLLALPKRAYPFFRKIVFPKLLF